jgi:hypothetical protein
MFAVLVVLLIQVVKVTQEEQRMVLELNFRSCPAQKL